MTQVLVHVSSADSGPVAQPLFRALGRAGVSWCGFFTNDAVKLLGSPDFVADTRSATEVLACEYSWDQHMEGECTVSPGSQTDNSRLMAEAERVVSL